MRILISNDDGVNAPGIKSLKKVLDKIAEVIVVAPLEERSSTGHTITLDEPLRLVKVDKDIYGCSGYPADCTLMGISNLLKDNRPDLIISGVNKGANLGQDTFYSGTVAAARESVFRGIPAISVSLTTDINKNKENLCHFDMASEFIAELVRKDAHKLISPMTVLNVNVPNLPKDQLKGVIITELGFRIYEENIQKRIDFRGKDYYWIAGTSKGFKDIDNSDSLAISEAKISLTPLNILANIADEKEKWSSFIEGFDF